MSDEIPQELVDRMMVKCGRRCCICRRFRPTKLQVHHIHERSQGGGNDDDNLIVICFSCHSDVHTKVPFARRFSREELKGHRDALVNMVANAILPVSDTDDTDEAMARLARLSRAVKAPVADLLPAAVEVLLATVHTEGDRAGLIVTTFTNRGFNLNAGARVEFFQAGDRRGEAKYRRAVEQLEECSLVDRLSESLLLVSYDGYLVADELMALHTGVSATA